MYASQLLQIVQSQCFSTMCRNEVTLLLKEVKETLQESKKQCTLNEEDLSTIVTGHMVLELLLMKRHKPTVLMSLREER
jgi:hypothetical protein